MSVPILGITHENDMWAFWIERLGSGKASEPEHVSVPVGEQYITDRVSTTKQYNPENFWREFFGKHRCIACGKPFRTRKEAFDCHPEASAWIVWQRYAFSGSMGSTSPSEALTTAIYNSGHGL